MTVRMGGWLLCAVALYVLWIVAATISDNTNLDGTLIQRTACGFLIISCWPAVFLEKLFGRMLTLPVALLIEGVVCWEAGRLVHRLTHRKPDRNANHTSDGIVAKRAEPSR